MLKLTILSVLLVGSFALPNPGSRIVNGTDAKEGEIPYIISLQYYGSHSCGGSILDATHVLTAAHCVYGDSPSALNIQYGILDVYSSENKIDVVDLVWHENYSPGGGYFNDVAVLTLAEPIQFSDTVKPTVLPEQSAPTPGEAPAVLAGWGYDKSGGDVMRFLQRVDLKVYTDDDCEYLHNYVTSREHHVCGGVVEGGKGQCSGDSGGPLYAEGKQVGIVSWSVKPCAIKGYPGVYAKVASYVDWIKKQMKN